MRKYYAEASNDAEQQPAPPRPQQPKPKKKQQPRPLRDEPPIPPDVPPGSGN